MTDALINRPTYIEQSMNLNSALGGGLVGRQPPRISSDGDKFTLLDETGEPHGTLAPSLSLDVVIVGSNDHVSQIFYKPKPPGVPETFDKPPLCFSDNGVGPSIRSSQPQNLTCSGCPRAAWTKTNALGKLVPWCQSRKSVAVLVAGAGETVYLLSVPPASLKQTWQPYINYLESKQAPAQCVITRIHIEKKIWQFKAVGWVPETSMAFIRETVAGDLPANVVNAFDKPILSLPAPTVGLQAVAEAVDSLVLKKQPDQEMEASKQHAAELAAPAKISFSLSSTPAPEPRGRGRARAQQEIIADQNKAADVQVGIPTPSFGVLKATPPPGLAGDRAGASFGMISDAPPPPADIQTTLDNVFARFGSK